MHNLRNKAPLPVLFILAIFVFSGCSKARPSEKIIATINGEPVYLKDFKKTLALRLRQNPSLQITSNTLDETMNMMIDKKLIIQEAMKKKLAEKEGFVETIESFWEQTLIRDFIDHKNKEAKSLLDVSDKEIEDYYEKLKTRVTFNIAKRTRRQDVDVLIQKARAGETIDWDANVSLSYEEVPSEALSKAFELPIGQMGIFKEGYMYYLVYIAGKQPIDVPSLKDAYSQIKEKIGQKKQRQAFSKWLKDKRSESDIEINKDVLWEGRASDRRL